MTAMTTTMTTCRRPLLDGDAAAAVGVEEVEQHMRLRHIQVEGLEVGLDRCAQPERRCASMPAPHVRLGVRNDSGLNSLGPLEQIDREVSEERPPSPERGSSLRNGHPTGKWSTPPSARGATKLGLPEVPAPRRRPEYTS